MWGKCGVCLHSPCGQMTKISSTYLSHKAGFNAAESSGFTSKPSKNFGGLVFKLKPLELFSDKVVKTWYSHQQNGTSSCLLSTKVCYSQVYNYIHFQIVITHDFYLSVDTRTRSYAILFKCSISDSRYLKTSRCEEILQFGFLRCSSLGVWYIQKY